MQLTDEQKKAVLQWVKDDCGLAEIQRRLRDEFQIALTYMDVRFLIIDLGLNVKDRDSRPKDALPVHDETEGELESADGTDESGADSPTAGGGAGQARIDVDVLTKPGAMVSGAVVFGDGVTASWMVDQAGRLAISSPTPGYRPSPEDLQAFQMELQAALEKRGF